MWSFLRTLPERAPFLLAKLFQDRVGIFLHFLDCHQTLSQENKKGRSSPKAFFFWYFSAFFRMWSVHNELNECLKTPSEQNVLSLKEQFAKTQTLAKSVSTIAWQPGNAKQFSPVSCKTATIKRAEKTTAKSLKKTEFLWCAKEKLLVCKTTAKTEKKSNS